MRSRLLLAVLAGLFVLPLPHPLSAEPKSLPEDKTPHAVVNASASASATAASAGKDAAEAKEPDTLSVNADKAAEKPKPLPPSLVAKVDLTRQRMEVIEHGASKFSWAISSGRQGYETPRGSFRAQWSAKMWYSQKYDLAPMPHAVFFHANGSAIHATTSVGLLGQPASHGCVRLAPANAATFYALVQKHSLKATQIQVFGQEPAPRIAKREVPRTPNYNRPQPPTYNGQQVLYLPPGSPHAGRPSFVHNGVLYVRVR